MFAPLNIAVALRSRTHAQATKAMLFIRDYIGSRPGLGGERRAVAMADSSSSAAAAAAAGTPERGPSAAPPPPWVEQTQERIRAREGARFISEARGPARWIAAEALRVEGRTGEPFAADEELQKLEADYKMVRYNLSLAAARFEPQRSTVMLCGRPVQASGKHNSQSSCCNVFNCVQIHI